MRTRVIFACLVVSVSDALSGEIICHSKDYPVEFGSTIELRSKKTKNSKTLYQAKFQLDKYLDTPTIRTKGIYEGFSSADADHDSIIHLKWYSGSYNSSLEEKLIPRRINIYSLDSNYKHKTMYIGVPEWLMNENAIIERHYVYTCE